MTAATYFVFGLMVVRCSAQTWAANFVLRRTSNLRFISAIEPPPTRRLGGLNIQLQLEQPKPSKFSFLTHTSLRCIGGSISESMSKMEQCLEEVTCLKSGRRCFRGKVQTHRVSKTGHGTCRRTGSMCEATSPWEISGGLKLLRPILWRTYAQVF